MNLKAKITLHAGVVIINEFSALRDKALRDHPLKQLVARSTRCETILDKIYTSAADSKFPPAILTNISSSNHYSILS